jgi:response regulator RpfG family c-di-GMP phosphodiesterase
MEIITQGDGRVEPGHFDPDVLAAFVAKQDEIRQIAHAYADSEEEKAATAGD